MQREERGVVVRLDDYRPVTPAPVTTGHDDARVDALAAWGELARAMSGQELAAVAELVRGWRAAGRLA